MGKSSKKARSEKESSKSGKESSKKLSPPASPELPAKDQSSQHNPDNPAQPEVESIFQTEKPADDFESRYLQLVTTEFADDLDKLRSAPDFDEDSLTILIDLLKQTGKVYTEEQKRIMMGEER